MREQEKINVLNNQLCQMPKSIGVLRYEKNPIITIDQIKPIDERFEVVGVFNPGTISIGGEIVLILRVAMIAKKVSDEILTVPYYNHELDEIEMISFSYEDESIDFSDSRYVIDRTGKRYLTSLSCLLVARSKDGINFEYDYDNYIKPFNKYHSYGLEDARIVEIEGDYYINFASASEYGIVTTLMKTKDFRFFEDLGIIGCPDNKDISLFPEKINGKYFMLHRPSCSEFAKPNIWIASGSQIGEAHDHRVLMCATQTGWDSGRIGSSSIPFKTEKGWLFLYHGATVENTYCLGAALLDASDPYKVIARTIEPFIRPEAEYEKFGFVNNVIFSCGCLYDDVNRLITIYYGAADDSICMVKVSIDEIFALLKNI